jgi:2-iminobutanoate/2-iminopropanoate deaminase
MVRDGRARDPQHQGAIAQGIRARVLAQEFAADFDVHGEDLLLASAPLAPDAGDDRRHQRGSGLGGALAAPRTGNGFHGRNVYRPLSDWQASRPSGIVDAMSRVAVVTEAAPKAIGPYTQAIAVHGAPLIFCSGQIAIDPRSGELAGAGEIRQETHRVMQNLDAVLRAAGSSLANVVKTTIFLVDLGHFSAVNEVYGGYFAGIAPARSTVQVAALPRGAQVEIEVIALGDS